MKKTFSKGVSLIIAAVLCLSLFPMTALAADSDFVIEDGVLVNYQGWGSGDVDVVVPDGVTSIGDGAFSALRASNMKSITIPDSVTSIGNHVFSECYQLTDVIIGNGVKVLAMVHLIVCLISKA